MSKVIYSHFSSICLSNRLVYISLIVLNGLVLKTFLEENYENWPLKFVLA